MPTSETKKITSIIDLNNFLHDLEEKYNLFNFNIFGANIWLSERMNIYYRLSQQTKLFDNHSPKVISNSENKELSDFEKCKDALGFFRTYISQYTPHKHIDNLIAAHGRVSLSLSNEIDPYMDSIVLELTNKGEQYKMLNIYKNIEHILKRRYSLIPIPEILNNVKNSPIRRKWYKKILSNYLKVSNEKLELLKIVDDEIHKFSGIDLQLKLILPSSAYNFIIQSWAYSILLKKHRVKTLYLSTGYFKMPLVFAANSLGIKTIEVQHGVISPFHLGYNYRYQPPLDYLPNQFLCWGSFWEQYLKLPHTQIQISGNQLFRQTKHNFLKTNKNPRTILIISQPVISKKLLQIILNNKNTLSTYQLIYKLHPMEFNSSEIENELSSLSSWKNVSIVREGDFYQLAAENEYVIGVFSTAIFEAIGFGCRLILIELPGIEYMQDLIRLYNVPVCNENSNLAEAINNSMQITSNNFF